MMDSPLLQRLLGFGRGRIQSLYAQGHGRRIGRLILLLTTTGRKSGLPRATPLQYEDIDGTLYVGAARGLKADWVRNILANAHVAVQVMDRSFTGTAEVITDAGRIADYLAVRLRRHAWMVGAMLVAEGLPPRPSREQLERYAARLVVVALRPEDGSAR